MDTIQVIYYTIIGLFIIMLLYRWFKGLPLKLYDNKWLNYIMVPIIVIGFLLNVTRDSFELYYNSDSYLNDRKLEVVDNYDNGLVEKNTFVPSDPYFEKVTIVKYDNGEMRVIYWADREKLDEGFFNFKWKVLSDYDFYLDPSNELDKEIILYSGYY